MVFILHREPTQQEVAATAKAMKQVHKFTESYDDDKTKLHKSPACKNDECVDCSDDTCPNFCKRQECPPECKKDCKNQLSRAKPKSVPFFIGEAGSKGRGLYAKTNISRDDRILYFTGEVISKEECLKRMEKYEGEGVEHSYLFECGKFVCDSTKHGNAGKFANNSCNANMHAVQWKIHNTNRSYRGVVFTAARDIKKGEELTIRYNFDCDPSVKRVCLCGELNCTGTMNKIAQSSKRNIKEEDHKKNGTTSKKRRVESSGASGKKKEKTSTFQSIGAYVHSTKVPKNEKKKYKNYLTNFLIRSQCKLEELGNPRKALIRREDLHQKAISSEAVNIPSARVAY
ncbi:unnamed protein product [Caenorhabditis nigoni]